MTPASLRESFEALSAKPKPGFWARLFGAPVERADWTAWNEQVLQALEAAQSVARRQQEIQLAFNNTLVEHEQRTVESGAAIQRLQEALATWETLRQPLRVLGAQVGALSAHAMAVQSEVARLARVAHEAEASLTAHHRQVGDLRETLQTLRGQVQAMESGWSRELQQVKEEQGQAAGQLSDTIAQQAKLAGDLQQVKKEQSQTASQLSDTIAQQAKLAGDLQRVKEEQSQAAGQVSDTVAKQAKLAADLIQTADIAEARANRAESSLAHLASQLGRVGATLDLDVAQFRQSQQAFAARLDAQGALQQNLAVTLATVQSVEAKLQGHDQQLATLYADRGPDDPAMFARFYLAFENQFRGTQEEIAAKTRPYLPAIKEALATVDSKAWLDLGCGRGEMLEQLTALGVEAVGVDTNIAMLELCWARGLTAHNADALEYLGRVPSECLLGISAYHLIEHLPYRTLLALVEAAARTLKPGGCLILETPNPQNVSVGACNFYMDLTHQKPIPPMTAEFLVRHAGFRRVEVLRLNPYERHAERDSLPTVTDREYCEMFYGPRDYGIVAFK